MSDIEKRMLMFESIVLPISTFIINIPEYATIAQDAILNAPFTISHTINNAVGSIFFEDPSAIPQSIARTNNDFAIDFYRQVSDNNSNIFFSPTSMYVAFYMLYEGAEQNTAKEIRQAFGFEPDEVRRHSVIKDTMSSLNRYDPHATLAIANSMWLADWFEPYDSYLDIGRGTYLADIERIQFPKDVDRINHIVSYRIVPYLVTRMAQIDPPRSTRKFYETGSLNATVFLSIL